MGDSLDVGMVDSANVSVKSRFNIEVDKEKCKGCGLCIYTCPREDVLEMTSEANRGGNHYVVYNADNCVGCKQCETLCPDVCISVTKR